MSDLELLNYLCGHFLSLLVDSYQSSRNECPDIPKVNHFTPDFQFQMEELQLHPKNIPGHQSKKWAVFKTPVIPFWLMIIKDSTSQYVEDNNNPIEESL